MWIVFTGKKDSPVIKNMIYNKDKLVYIRLDRDEWIEEFEIENKKEKEK